MLEKTIRGGLIKIKLKCGNNFKTLKNMLTDKNINDKIKNRVSSQTQNPDSGTAGPQGDWKKFLNTKFQSFFEWPEKPAVFEP